MLSTNTTKRILKDLDDIRNDPAAICSAGPLRKDDISHWQGALIGPQGTPYENGVFILDIQFPLEYPSKAPLIKFITEIYHPNISNTGDICVDILKEGSWNPKYSVGKVLVALDCLLHHPNPFSALNREAAELCKTDPISYNEKASMWTKTFARPPQ